MEGEVIGRGSQDMKCVIAQYLVAIERLIGQGVRYAASIAPDLKQEGQQETACSPFLETKPDVSDLTCRCVLLGVCACWGTAG